MSHLTETRPITPAALPDLELRKQTYSTRYYYFQHVPNSNRTAVKYVESGKFAENERALIHEFLRVSGEKNFLAWYDSPEGRARAQYQGYELSQQLRRDTADKVYDLFPFVVETELTDFFAAGAKPIAARLSEVIRRLSGVSETEYVDRDLVLYLELRLTEEEDRQHRQKPVTIPFLGPELMPLARFYYFTCDRETGKHTGVDWVVRCVDLQRNWYGALSGLQETSQTPTFAAWCHSEAGVAYYQELLTQGCLEEHDQKAYADLVRGVEPESLKGV